LGIICRIHYFLAEISSIGKKSKPQKMVGVSPVQDKAKERDQPTHALIVKLVCICMIVSIAATYIYLQYDSW
jgi:hypothetical protein